MVAGFLLHPTVQPGRYLLPVSCKPCSISSLCARTLVSLRFPSLPPFSKLSLGLRTLRMRPVLWRRYQKKCSRRIQVQKSAQLRPLSVFFSLGAVILLGTPWLLQSLLLLSMQPRFSKHLAFQEEAKWQPPLTTEARLPNETSTAQTQIQRGQEMSFPTGLPPLLQLPDALN